MGTEQHDSESPDYIERLAQLLQKGLFKEALAVAREAVQSNPDDPSLWYVIGRLLRDTSEFEEALAAIEKAIRLDSDVAAYWDDKGSALYGLGRLEEALGAYEKAILLDLNDYVPMHNKGNVLYDLGRLEEALAAYEKAIVLDRDNAPSWNSKGRILRSLGRSKEAVAAFEEAIRIDPNRSDHWNAKGNALGDLGRLEEALAAYEKAIVLDRDAAFPWNGKGSALRDLSRFEEALEAYEEAIRLDRNCAIAWYNVGVLLRAKRYLRMEHIDGNPKQCLVRAVFLAWPSRSRQSVEVLRMALLEMHEYGETGLLLERIVSRTIPEGGLLMIERILSQVKEETEVAHAVFGWLDGSDCPLHSVERRRLRGQVFVRFGDPIMAHDVLDEPDNTEEGERDLAGQLYLVWSLQEYLQPHDEELGVAYKQAQKWMGPKENEYGPADEVTYYYAGHIALAKGDLPMARSAFDRAVTEPAALLMAWHTAHLARDAAAVAEYLDLLLEAERECLRAGRTGVLFPGPLHLFDPKTTEGQAELQLVLREYEVREALMDLLASVNLLQHPKYQELANDFAEHTKAFIDIERYEHAVLTWKVTEEIRLQLEQRQVEADRQVAEKKMQERPGDFQKLGVQFPCSLRREELEERLGQSLFGLDLSGCGKAVVEAIALMLPLGWLKSEQVVLLCMYAHAKAHYDAAGAREARVKQFAARTGLEGVLFCLLRDCGVAPVTSLMAAIGGWTVARKTVDLVQAMVGDLQADGGKAFPTYPEFKRHLHRYWSESGDSEGLRWILGLDDDSSDGTA